LIPGGGGQAGAKLEFPENCWFIVDLPEEPEPGFHLKTNNQETSQFVLSIVLDFKVASVTHHALLDFKVTSVTHHAYNTFKPRST
jgi:hypothetical protein